MRIKTTVTEAKKKKMHTTKTISTTSKKKKQQQENKWNKRKKCTHTHNDGDRRWTRMNEMCCALLSRATILYIEMHAPERKTSPSFR